MTRRRRLEVQDLAQRYQHLPPEEAGRVGLVLLVNALVSGALQCALLVMYVRLVRRLWAARSDGARPLSVVARSRFVILSTCAYGCYAALDKLLLLRWARNVADRVERETKEQRVAG